MKNLGFWIAFPVALALSGCGGDEPAVNADASVSDMGGDAGTPTDMGARDGSRTDAGSDPCAATVDNASDTIGCNGDILGPDIADGAFGGRCTAENEEDVRGTCTDEDAVCVVLESGMPGICMLECDRPAGTPYVSTSSCPSGSRCFELDSEEPVGYCYIDCEYQEDCLGEADGFWCDADGACEPPPPPPDEEDAGVPEDAGEDLDGGVPDATTSETDADTDAATDVDASS